MAENKPERVRVGALRIIDCGESLPIPPGTKSKARLPRGEEELVEPSATRPWLLGGCAVAVALIAGILIGRFLL